MYKENPKTKGSGIICCIPHSEECPLKCEDCFFQSGRSYLEPLADHLPNMPTLAEVGHRVVRVNDGNDSNNNQKMVMGAVKRHPLKFYNTSLYKNLEAFDAPVVLTVNPGVHTDTGAVLLEEPPVNLMFVRFRINTWNIIPAKRVIQHYTQLNVPVVLTFMAYHELKSIPTEDVPSYILRKRTLNEYYAITKQAWYTIMSKLAFNTPNVYSCGKVEGESNGGCKTCGNCLREFYRTFEKMKEEIK